MYRMTLDEQETIIRYDRAGDTATIYTADPVVMRRLDDLASKTTLVNEKRRDEYGRWYECPKSMVRVQRVPTLTEDERQKRAERAKAMRGCGS